MSTNSIHEMSDSDVRVKCPRSQCGYEWDTKSKKILVSCPKCTYKLEIKKCVIIRDTNTH